MESLCGAPLYHVVENGIEISTRSCSQVLYDIGNCDASYLYFNERFFYTFACPIGSNEIEIVTTTTVPSVFSNRSNSSFLRGSKSITTFPSSYNTSKNTTDDNENNTSNINNTTNKANETLGNSSTGAVFVYSIKASEKNDSSSSTTGNPILPPFAVALIVVFSFMSVLSIAVLLYFKNKRKKKMQKRPSTIMPEIVRHGPSSVRKEVKAVLNKIINTICRRNGEEPYLQKAPESAPPLPPRPPRVFSTQRSEALQYLRQTNPHLGKPHSAIQSALNKPSENFRDAGQRRADILQREANLERLRQERRNKSHRLQRIVRLRELHSKNGKEGPAKKEEEAH